MNFPFRSSGLCLLAAMLLTACALQGQAPITPTETSPLPAATPTPEPTLTPTCPRPVQGTTLLRQEQLGYCLLYPADYVEVHTEPDQVCLVQGETNMMCHSASAFFNVEDAAGRSPDQVADEMIADAEAAVPGIAIQRTSSTVAGQPAVVLEGLPGVTGTRDVLIAQADRLYRLTFILPAADQASLDQFERLYSTVINSFTFVPSAAPSAAPTATPSSDASPEAGGSAVVVFVRDGNIAVWDEATGSSQTIVDSGDVIRVELSDDGQLVAFLRRSFFAVGGFDRNEQSALWVVGRDGANPRELISAQQLRQRLDAAEDDSTNFPRLAWIPKSHRLLYSGDTYAAYGEGESAHVPTRGVYLVDAETGAEVVLAPPEESFHFVPSPDGRQVVLVNTTGLSFFDVDSGRQRLEFPAAPVVGDTGWFTNAGVWTQDSTAFVINALVEPTNILSDYALWRVPVDGTPAAALISFAAGTGSVIFSPDGSAGAYLGAASGTGPSTWFIVPLPEDLGPVAVPRDTFDYAHLTWSPASSSYVLEALSFDPQGVMHGRENLFSLCPNAVQAVEVCGPAIHLGEQIEWQEWLDRSRFLYVTYQPRRLYLGSLEGSATLIAEDPPSFDAVAATCSDDSEFVADVTVPDGTHFAPGTVFQKTWRIRNSGTCTWDASYRITFLSGDRMMGPRSAPLDEPVLPGEEVDVSVMLIAPEAAGTYQGQWQMFAPDGTPFGTRPYVVIVVQ